MRLTADPSVVLRKTKVATRAVNPWSRLDACKVRAVGRLLGADLVVLPFLFQAFVQPCVVLDMLRMWSCPPRPGVATFEESKCVVRGEIRTGVL